MERGEKVGTFLFLFVLSLSLSLVTLFWFYRDE
jgi:hypothetical protein